MEKYSIYYHTAMFFCSCIFCCALRVLFHKFLSLHEKFIYNEHENNFLCKSSQNFQLSQYCCDIMCQLAALSTTLTRILKIFVEIIFLLYCCNSWSFCSVRGFSLPRVLFLPGKIFNVYFSKLCLRLILIQGR